VPAHGVGEPAQRLRRGKAVGGRALGQLDEPGDAELGAVGVARLHDAVAVQEQPVARLEEFLGGLRGLRGDRCYSPERHPPRGVQAAYGPAAAQQHRSGVSRGEVAQPPRDEVEPGQHPGDEPEVGELPAERPVDPAGHVEEIHALPAGGACRGERDGGGETGAQIVPRRVEDRELCLAGTDRVVEGVPAHVVGGFEQGRERERLRADGQRWQQLPEQLARHGHRSRALHGREQVAVLELGGEDVGERAGDDGAPRTELRVACHRAAGRQPHADHAEALDAVDERDPEDVVVGFAPLQHRPQLVGPAGERPVRADRRDAFPQRTQLDLLVVDEVDLGAQPQRSEDVVERGRDRVPREEVGPLDQVEQRPLPACIQIGHRRSPTTDQGRQPRAISTVGSAVLLGPGCGPIGFPIVRQGDPGARRCRDQRSGDVLPPPRAAVQGHP